MDKLKYVAFFRSINVGGKNIVRMSDLSQLFSGLGFRDVKTYIQSGNVIFSSDKEQHLLIPLIEQAFERQFGFSSAVVVRLDTEIESIADAVPFGKTEIEQAQSENPDVEHIYVYLSNSPIGAEKVYQLCASYNGKDKFQVINREIYLLCFQSIRDSKLAAMLVKLPQPLTSRNLKTIEKISLRT
jgi:uncharacterized protein (DUF1697 family)